MRADPSVESDLLLEAKSLVKHNLLERVNEAVKKRENLRHTLDIHRRLDKRLLDSTTDDMLAQYKVCFVAVCLVIVS